MATIEVHMTGVGNTITAGTVAAPVTINFKRLGMSFPKPSLETNVDDAGQFEGNHLAIPQQELAVSFTAFITATQQLEDLNAIFDGGAETLIYTAGGAGASPDTFFAIVCDFDFSSAEEGNTVTFNCRAQGWKQGVETYGYQGV